MNARQSQLNLQRNRIFFSYAKEDSSKVEVIYDQFVKAALNPWMDKRDLQPGDDWESVITQTIKSAGFVLAFLSMHSVNKRGFVQREIKEALDVAATVPQGKVFIVPVRLEECLVPDRLKKWHWINLFDKNGLQKVISLVRSELGIKDTKVTPNKPNVPSRDEITDGILASLIEYSASYTSVRLSSGRTAITNAYFMEVLDRVPRKISQLSKFFLAPVKLTERMTKQVVPSRRVYRRDSYRLKEIKPSTRPYSYILVAKNNKHRCAVNKRYFDYALMKYPESKIYIRGNGIPLILEDSDGVVRFVLMPMVATDKELNAK
jgi:hypothetical protein